MRICTFLICLANLGFSFGQSQTEIEQQNLKNKNYAHSELKQFNLIAIDSIVQDSSSSISVGLLPEAIAAYEPTGFATTSGLLLDLKGNMGKRWTIRSLYRVGYTSHADLAYISSLQAKSLFRNSFKKNDGIYHDIRGRITYKPNEIFTLETGIDHLYIGEGERSILAGNQGVPLPFIQATATFWKFSYLFSQQVGFEKRFEKRSPKGISSHYLSFNATKKWNIGIFETVVYDMRDTLYNRGFEPEYLNPLIFYRPQEYSLGSADNVMIGLHTSYAFSKHKVYAQFILDEFLLSELKARSRWWANKYGLQLGIKGLFDLKGNEVFYRTELNLIRPFTYAHTAPGVVYGNAFLPLAHPLGSNFVEIYHEFASTIKDWRIEVWVQMYLKGTDYHSSSLSYGGDIYQSYINYAMEYGATIGSGQTYRSLQLGTQISRRFMNDNLRVFIEPRGFVSNNEGNISTTGYITMGLQSPLGGKRRNY